MELVQVNYKYGQAERGNRPLTVECEPIEKYEAIELTAQGCVDVIRQIQRDYENNHSYQFIEGGKVAAAVKYTLCEGVPTYEVFIRQKDGMCNASIIYGANIISKGMRRNLP